MNHLSIRALEEFPLINPGDNLSSIILDSIEDNDITTVSYTHLTLPTIYSV